MQSSFVSKPLLGRLDELAALRGRWDSLADSGAYVHLSGPPGIGKTALLRACAAEARGHGLQVLRAAGTQAEQTLPFATLHQLLRPLLPGVDELPSGQRNALLGAFGMNSQLPTTEPARIGLAALELLSDSAVQRPVLGIVDDFQWADPASREVLDFIARRLTTEPAMLLVATREAPPTGLRPPQDQDWTHLRLEPLSDHDASRLLAQHAPALTSGERDRILKLSQGNPLALLELPRSAAGSDTGAEVPLTERLRHTFAGRLEECPPEARALLLVAALQDSDQLAETEKAVAVLLGHPLSEQQRAHTLQAGLVDIEDGRIRFRHPLMRSAVVKSSSPEDVSAAHRALAQVLADDLDRATWHRAAAVHQPDADVAQALEVSADRALHRGAPMLALTFLERAAQLSPQASQGGHRLLRAAEVSFELGRPETVHALIDQVRARPLLPEDTGRLVALETAFDDGVPGGELLVQRLQQSAAEAVAAGDSELAVNLLIRGGRACYWGGSRNQQLLGALRAVTDQLDLSREDPRVLLVDAFLSPFAKGAAIVHCLQEWSARDTVDPALTGLLAMASFVSGSFEHTVPMTTAAESGLRKQGRLGPLTQVLVLQAFAALYLGQWEFTATASDAALRFAEETGQSTWAACARLGLANLAAIRGRHRQAMRLLADVQEAVVVSGNASVANGMQLTRGLAALGQEDPGLAFEEFGRMLDPSSPSYQSPQCAWVLDYYAEAAYAAGRQAEALVQVRTIEEQALGTPAGGVRRALALAHALLAEEDQAPARFAQARELRANSSPWYQARLDLAEGAWLRRRRRSLEGRGLLQAAQQAFAELDAPAWAARAARELAAAGQPVNQHRPGRWAKLSPQELQIARLAGQGLSNREIGEQLYLSHRTVGSHLYRIFPKLGIHNRAQLSDALTEQDSRL